MANDTDKNPARRIEDHRPKAEIQWDKPGAPAVAKPSTAGAARQGGNTSPEGLTNRLHNEIMNLPSNVPESCKSHELTLAYKIGHRDARHAAAELVFDADFTPIPPLTAPAPLTDTDLDVIEEAAQVLESGAKHNRENGRTVLAHAQQTRADRLRAIATKAAPQQSESIDTPEFRDLLDAHYAFTNFQQDETAAAIIAYADSKISAAKAAPAAPVQTEPVDIGEMVNRFLGWKLPQDFCPDAGISFNAPQPPFGWPTGTNLLHAGQAKEMFKHCLQGAMRPTDDHLWDETIRDRDTYQEWADKLANAIATHFGAEIGEHSNMNCPWAEALEVIEAAPVQAVTEQARNEALEEAAKVAEETDVETIRWCGQVLDDGSKTRDSIAAAIRALAAPSTTPSNDTGALGDTGGEK
jgi:hypothetical protein